MGELVQVSIAALDPMLEVGATSALRGCPEVEVVHTAARVTVVIVDDVDEQVLGMVRDTRAAQHRPEVVLVATDLAPSAALQAIVVGARGLLRRREASPDRLVRTVLAAAGGDCTVPPDMLDQLLEQGGTMLPASVNGPGLSERERAVLRLVADGHETGEIAQKLCYSARTVSSVVHDITHRFRLRNRAHAVAYTLRAGLL